MHKMIASITDIRVIEDLYDDLWVRKNQLLKMGTFDGNIPIVGQWYYHQQCRHYHIITSVRSLGSRVEAEYNEIGLAYNGGVVVCKRKQVYDSSAYFFRTMG